MSYLIDVIMYHIMLHRNHGTMIGTALDLAQKHSTGRLVRAAPGAAHRMRQAHAWVSAPRCALLLLLLLAFVWQGFVSQTHRHSNPVATAAAVTAAAQNPSPAGDQPADTPANCSICRELAGSGPALLPVALSIAVPDHPPFVATTANLPPQTLVRRTHLWRSRAPPFFQA